MKKEFYLVDYKGKFTIACDELDELDYEVSRISKEDFIKQADWRKQKANYYGVPAYIGNDKELNKLFNN